MSSVFSLCLTILTPNPKIHSITSLNCTYTNYLKFLTLFRSLYIIPIAAFSNEVLLSFYFPIDVVYFTSSFCPLIFYFFVHNRFSQFLSVGLLSPGVVSLECRWCKCCIALVVMLTPVILPL